MVRQADLSDIITITAPNPGMYALQQYLPLALGLTLVAASLNSTAPDSIQSDLSAVCFGAFATLALAFGLSAWLTVSYLLATKHLTRAGRKSDKFSRLNRKQETRTVGMSHLFTCSKQKKAIHHDCHVSDFKE